MSVSIKKSSLATKSDIQLLRKLFHVLMGSFVFWCYLTFDHLSKTEYAMIAFCVGLLAFVIDLIRSKNENINQLFLKLAGPIIRRSEYRGLTGIPFFALGCAGALYFFPEKMALLSILYLIFADPIATIVGVKYGRDKIMPGKSLQGSMAFFVVCFVITFIFLHMIIPSSPKIVAFCTFSSIVGMCSELLGHWVDDNFSIPIFSCLGIYFLNVFFVIF